MFFTTDDSFVNVYCNVFYELSFGKVNINRDGIKIFSFSIEKVLKKYGKLFLKICGNPVCIPGLNA